MGRPDVRAPRPTWTVSFTVTGRLGAGRAGAFQRHQSPRRQLDHPVGQRGDLVRGVDRRHGHRQVLGRAQRAVGAQLMPRPEAGDATQHDAGGHRVVGVQVQQLVGEEVALVPLSLTEVGGELEQVVGHSAPPARIPSHAMASPSTTLTAMLANAPTTWRSSARRCVSSIQVENVV